MGKLILFSFLFIFLSAFVVYSQPQFEWVRNYPMQGQSIALDSLGNIYVLGNPNSNIHIIKYNNSGSIIWSRDMPINYGGTNLFAASDKDGNLYFSIYDGDDSHFRLTKYDSSGNYKWNRYFITGGYNTYTEGIALDTSGNIFLTGKSRLGVYYYFTLKYNSQGDTLWTAKYNYNFGGSVPYSIFVDKPGNVYVTGISWGDGDNSDYATIKYNNNGLQQWVVRYDGPYHGSDYAYFVIVDDEGYCYVTGGASVAADHLDFCTIKYSPSGDSVWTRLFIPPIYRNWSYGTDIKFDENNNVYIVGGGGDTNYHGSLIGGFQIIKYDKNGNFMYSVIDTNGAELAPVCKFKNNIYLTGNNKSGTSIYSSGYNLSGNRIFYSFYPCSNPPGNPYFSNKILSYKNDYLLIFSRTLIPSVHIDSSIIIKYSDMTGINNYNHHVENNKSILFNNYPNPFNINTIIKYQVDKYCQVKIKIFDILSREIKTLVNEKKLPGIFEINFEGNKLPTGIYFYTLFVNDEIIKTKKMIMVK